MRSLFLLGLFAVAAVTPAMVLDDFTTGQFIQKASMGERGLDWWWGGSQSGTMIGKERDVQIRSLYGTSAAIARDGTLTFRQDRSAEGAMALEYDGVGEEVGTTWEFERGPGLDLDLLGNRQDRFRFHAFNSNAKEMAVRIEVYTYGDIQSPDRTSARTLSLTSQDATTFDASFDSFTGDADFSNADRIRFVFLTEPGDSFSLGGIDAAAIPEPATLAALAIGLLGLTRKRRSRLLEPKWARRVQS